MKVYKLIWQHCATSKIKSKSTVVLFAFSVVGGGGLRADPGRPSLDARVPSSGVASASVASGSKTQQMESAVLIGGHDGSSGSFLLTRQRRNWHSSFQQNSNKTQKLYLTITIFKKLGADEVSETTASGLLATNCRIFNGRGDGTQHLTTSGFFPSGRDDCSVGKGGKGFHRLASIEPGFFRQTNRLDVICQSELDKYY